MPSLLDDGDQRTKLLLTGTKIVGFLLGAFGGFLTSTAPPDTDGLRIGLGASSLGLLCLLLFLSRARRRALGKWGRLGGLTAASGIVLAIGYRWTFDSLTYEIGGTRQLGGLYVQPDAREYGRKYGKSTSDLIADYGADNRQLVWSATSQSLAQLFLDVHYVLMVLSFGAAVFCSAEAALGPGKGAAK
jgi:hypothetical protein